MKIIRAENGKDQQAVDVNKIRIPDLWHIATRKGSKDIDTDKELLPQIDAFEQAKILECWHLAQDLLGAMRSIQNGANLKKPIHTK